MARVSGGSTGSTDQGGTRDRRGSTTGTAAPAAAHRAGLHTLRIPLPVEVAPAEALRVLAGDRYPFALLGQWAGGGALLGSEPLWARAVGHDEDPFALLAPERRTTEPLAPGAFLGALTVGSLSYRLGERLFGIGRPGPAAPLAFLARYDHVLRFVAAEGRWYLEGACDDERLPFVRRRATDLVERLSTLGAPEAVPAEPGDVGDDGRSPVVLRCRSGRRGHVVAVERCVQAIHAGELFEANICTSFEARFDGSLLCRFVRAARRLEPAYAAYLDTGAVEIASLSPELFLSCDGVSLRTEPIKGTRPRGQDPVEADATRFALERSGKDLAENVTIVDLLRNDLAASTRSGTVRVEALAAPRPGPGVWNLVSTVTARLAPGADLADALRRAFPPGSVTGAPKARALELAAEVEATARDVYTGSIGYLCPLDGRGEWNVAIRTFERHRDRVRLGVGGGITAESLPGQEWEECLVKARPLAKAMGFALAEDDPAGTPVRAARPWGGSPEQGVFSTLLVLEGVPVEAWRHLRRLAWSAEALYGIALPEGIEGTLLEAAAGWRRARLRVELDPQGTLRTQVAPFPASRELLGVAAGFLAVPGPLGPHKLVDRRHLEALVAPLRAEGTWPLLLAPHGEVTEADIANVAVLRDGALVVAPDDGQALPGVGREVLLEVAADRGLSVEYRPLTPALLESSDAILLTNALRGVVPVRDLIGTGYRLRCPDLVADLQRLVDERWQHEARLGPPPLPSAPEPRRANRPPRPARRPAGACRLVLLDNRDSFVHTLAHLLEQAGAQVRILPSHGTTLEELLAERPSGLVLSPGPGRPEHAGLSQEAVRALSGRLPILGVCLGHQAIAQAFGGRIVRARRPLHGRLSVVRTCAPRLLADLPPSFLAARYHALAVDPARPGEDLRVTALADDGTVMALEHRSHPTIGLQFHPEAVQSEHGDRIADRFVELCLTIAGSTPAR